LAVADYQDGFTNCQGLNGQGRVILTMIYNDLLSCSGTAPVMYRRRLITRGNGCAASVSRVLI
jgi:hypothetical protein